MTVKKVRSSSTLPKTTSLKYSKILSFKITLKVNLLHIWVVKLQSCKGFMVATLGFHGGHKETRLLFK
jgi:hypothetical protein